MAVTPISDFNHDPAVARTLDVIAQAFVERLGAGYERQRTHGGAEFTADVWYRMNVSESRPLISFVVVVKQPVFGLGPYLSKLSASMAQGFDWAVDFETAVRLDGDVDADGMREIGWRHCSFPPDVEPPILSTEPPSDAGKQETLAGV